MSVELGAESGYPAVPYLEERTFAFASRVIKVCHVIDGSGGSTGRMLAAQLLKVGTAIGAAVAESVSAPSLAEYFAGIATAGRLARETRFWLRLIVDADILREASLDGLLDEVGQIDVMLTETRRLNEG
jgi:four helix bundle protein